MNPYCQILGIDVPSLRALKDHREANTYTLMIVALLEEGAPLTLKQIAARFSSRQRSPPNRWLFARCSAAAPTGARWPGMGTCTRSTRTTTRPTSGRSGSD